MMFKGFKFYLLAVMFVIIAYIIPFNLVKSKSINELSFPYPGPQETQSELKNPDKKYLPIVFNPYSHFYAKAEKVGGVYFGVWARITTANPTIREQYFSYATINISDPDGRWIETGYSKGQFTDCIPKFTFAIQPGTPTVVQTPVPRIGATYRYLIQYMNNPGQWKIYIYDNQGILIFNQDIINEDMIIGVNIQAGGEVDSVQKLNDMGRADLLLLRWREFDGFWRNWDGYIESENEPYNIVGLQPDPNNNVRISGNNGNPIPPNPPCP